LRRLNDVGADLCVRPVTCCTTQEMSYDPQLHHRRSIRLRGYDYSQANPYFLTLCTQEGLCLFGDIVDCEMRLSVAGQMIQKWWHELERKFPNTLTDSFQIMPNHLHVVFVILGDGLDMAARFGAWT
jgi:putative transposase